MNPLGFDWIFVKVTTVDEHGSIFLTRNCAFHVFMECIVNINRDVHLSSNFTSDNLCFEIFCLSHGLYQVSLGQTIGLSRLCLSCDIYDQFTQKSKQIIYKNILVQQTSELFGGLK